MAAAPIVCPRCGAPGRHLGRLVLVPVPFRNRSRRISGQVMRLRSLWGCNLCRRHFVIVAGKTFEYPPGGPSRQIYATQNPQ